MSFEKTSVRLWKRLDREERRAAAEAFWNEPAEEVLGKALDAIARARHMRPQAVRTLPAEQRTSALASLLDPGEPLAASLLVALHLAHRRPLLTDFLDALGLPHEEGVLTEEADAAPAVSAGAAQEAAGRLLAAHPLDQVRTYLNTLWLQDPERWAALAEVELRPPSSSSPEPAS